MAHGGSDFEDFLSEAYKFAAEDCGRIAAVSSRTIPKLKPPNPEHGHGQRVIGDPPSASRAGMTVESLPDLPECFEAMVCPCLPYGGIWVS